MVTVDKQEGIGNTLVRQVNCSVLCVNSSYATHYGFHHLPYIHSPINFVVDGEHIINFTNYYTPLH